MGGDKSTAPISILDSDFTETEKDHKLWNQIPSLKINNYEQLHQVIVQRFNQMNRWIELR